jgi:DNA-binding response OmpR family regulator
VAFFNKIVVCDDEDAIAHLINMALGDAGYLCLRARDGEQAIFLATVESPDLMILDVMMPKVDGMAACKKIKSDPILSRIPILMLTSLAGVDDKVKGLEAGADDYLAKPFDLRELHARVRALLRSSRRERDRSPTTHLPGPAALESAVEEQFAAKKPFALIHAELDGFDAYVDHQGWKSGEALTASVGRALAVVARGLVLTHIGGDDFALVVPGGASEVRQTVDALREAAAGVLPSHLEVRLRTTVVESSAATNADGLARAMANARRRAALA